MSKKWYHVSVYKADTEFEQLFFCEQEEIPQWTSMSPGYTTLAELQADLEIPGWRCTKCGGVVKLSFTNRAQLEEHKMCFKCNHFREVMETAKVDKNRVIIDHASYHIEKAQPKAPSQGFGGRQFNIIRFDDPNQLVICKNLWHQGDIPKIWQNDIPNNAQFVKRVQEGLDFHYEKV